jgi:hypothetical protein
MTCHGTLFDLCSRRHPAFRTRSALANVALRRFRVRALDFHPRALPAVGHKENASVHRHGSEASEAFEGTDGAWGGDGWGERSVRVCILRTLTTPVNQLDVLGQKYRFSPCTPFSRMLASVIGGSSWGSPARIARLASVSGRAAQIPRHDWPESEHSSH